MGFDPNLGKVYTHLVRDMREGTYTTPGFGHALLNASLIAAVPRARPDEDLRSLEQRERPF
jgi:hypothetical protein